MALEILSRDLAGRVCKLETRRGPVETPLFLPVVNPTLQSISPEQMREDFGCHALITNAYLLKKNHEEEVLARGVHDFLKFDGLIVTDSGGYQILVYGDVDISPEEIVRFQEDIETDVAVILDIPTGWNAARERAEYTVNETLRRARTALSILTKKNLLWVGPVQGGNHLDLVSRSASEIGKMRFDIYALGSPTQVVEHYLFDVLTDMIVAAKTNLPVEKPFHLFGAGHPFMLSFAVALGCDIFDSAAYALYARRGKYMTSYGTMDLSDLRYFPCLCKVCSKYTPRDLLEMPSKERERLLAWHNLGECFTEIKRIKEAINEGRLWELLELRAKSHPSLLQALKHLAKYADYLEAGVPTSKEKGMLYFGSSGLARPEITRYCDKIKRWVSPTSADVLVLMPQPSSKPFHRSREYEALTKLLSEGGQNIDKIHVCIYAAPYGLIPLELDETYPLSQFEAAFPLDEETVDYVAEQVEDYLRNRNSYKIVVLQSSPIIGEKVEAACRRAVEPEKLIISSSDNVRDIEAAKNLVEAIGIAFKTLERNSKGN